MGRIHDSGFEEAFQGLFVHAYHVALRILDRSGEAEDVAAEALARTLRSWRRVRGFATPEAWVTRVTTNLAIDVVRRRKWVDEALADESRPSRPDDTDTRLAMRELLRSLPRRQRDVLALRYLADLSEADVATALGISIGTVKRHASRGIARLRQRLGNPDDSQEAISLAW